MIEVMDAATLLTNLRYTKNPEWAIVVYEWSINNAFMNRIKNQTPIKELYLASGWGNPGGGYSGVMRGGQSTFKALMEDWRHKAKGRAISTMTLLIFELNSINSGNYLLACFQGI